MPVIPKMNPARQISNRVQNIEQNTSAVGASAKILASVGGSIADLSNELLLKRKQAEAVTYNLNEGTKTSRMREQVGNFLKLNMDPSDGVIKFNEERRAEANALGVAQYENTRYGEAMSGFELEREKEVLNTAPTDLAKDMYREKQGPSARLSIINSDKYEHKTKAENHDKNNASIAKRSALDISVHDDSMGESALQRAESDIDRIKRDYYENAIGVYYDQNSAEESYRKHWNPMANNVFFNLLEHNENIPETIRGLNTTIYSEQGQALLRSQLQDIYGNVPEGKVVPLSDGGKAITKGGKIITKFGPTGMVEASKQDIQEVKMSSINVGLGERNPIEDLLTPKQKVNWLRKLSKKMDDVSKKNLKELNDEHKQLLASFLTPHTDLRGSEDELKDHSQRVKNLVGDKDQRRKMLFDIGFVATAGDIAQDMALMNPSEMEQAIETTKLPEIFMQKATDLELLEDDLLGEEEFRKTLDSARFKTDLKTKIRDMLVGGYGNLRRELVKGAGVYGEKHSPILKKRAESFISNPTPENWKKYRLELSDFQDRVQVPEGSKVLASKNVVSEYANQFKQYANNINEDGGKGLTAWLSNMKVAMGEDFIPMVRVLSDSDTGINESMFYSQFLIEEGGIKTNDKFYLVQRMLQNSQFNKDLLDSYKSADNNFRVQDFQSEIARQMEPYLEGATTNNIYGGKNKTPSMLMKVVFEEAIRRDHDNNGYSEIEGDEKGFFKKDKYESSIQTRVKESIDLIINKNFSLVEGRSNRLLIPDQTLRDNKTNPEAVKKAMDKMVRPNYVMKKTDIVEVFNRELKEQGLDLNKLTPEQQENFVRSLVDDKKIGVSVEDNDMVPIYRPDSGVPIPLTDKKNKNKIHKVPLKEVNDFIKEKKTDMGPAISIGF